MLRDRLERERLRREPAHRPGQAIQPHRKIQRRHLGSGAAKGRRLGSHSRGQPRGMDDERIPPLLFHQPGHQRHPEQDQPGGGRRAQRACHDAFQRDGQLQLAGGRRAESHHLHLYRDQRGCRQVHSAQNYRNGQLHRHGDQRSDRQRAQQHADYLGEA